jgi:hypothetical protein
MKPLFALAALALAATAQAQVITIDQAKALAGNVTPGDAPGFPVTISQPGSYRLMSSLTVPDMSTTALHITSADVAVDLNGFALRGPNVCSGKASGLNCTSYGLPGNTPRGHGVLVQAPAGSAGTVAVENGNVRGFGGYGLWATDGSNWGLAARRLQVIHNGWTGISNASLVSDSVVSHNGTNGITFSHNVTRNTVVGNRSVGIYGSGTALNDSHSNGTADTANRILQ